MSKTRRIPVFFYGSFINVDVLKDVDVVPETLVVTRLHGWEIQIAPLANLVPKDQGVVYGVNADCSHEELERLYSQSWVGTYLPEPVLVEIVKTGGYVPAVTYVKWDVQEGRAAADYVERIAGPGERLGFPPWYLDHLRSFV